MLLKPTATPPSRSCQTFFFYTNRRPEAIKQKPGQWCAGVKTSQVRDLAEVAREFLLQLVDFLRNRVPEHTLRVA